MKGDPKDSGNRQTGNEPQNSCSTNTTTTHIQKKLNHGYHQKAQEAEIKRQ